MCYSLKLPSHLIIVLVLLTAGLCASCKGEKGDPGPQGIQGVASQDGAPAYFTFDPGVTVTLQGATLSDGTTPLGGDTEDDVFVMQKGDAPYFKYNGSRLEILLYEHFDVLLFDGSLIVLSINIADLTDKTTISELQVNADLEKSLNASVIHAKYVLVYDIDLSNKDNVVINSWSYDTTAGELSFDIILQDESADGDGDGAALGNANVGAVRITGTVPVVTVLERPGQ